MLTLPVLWPRVEPRVGSSRSRQTDDPHTSRVPGQRSRPCRSRQGPGRHLEERGRWPARHRTRYRGTVVRDSSSC